MSNSFLNVLRFPNFKKMWLAQVFSQVALNMVTFALVLHIFELTGKATSVSLVMLASAVPVALIGPFSGVLADKIDYRKILIYTNFLRFIAAILLLVSNGNILALLEIIFFISAISQIFTPAESSAVPLIVPREKLMSANSVVITTTYATLLIGYGVAGPILNYIGPSWLFIICALLFLLATFMTRQMTKFDHKPTKKISLVNFADSLERAWKDVKSGFLYIRSEAKIFNPMIKLTVGWTILGAFITLLPAFGQDALHVNAKLIAPLVILPAGVGLLLSATLLSRKKHFTHQKEINKGFIIFAVPFLIFSLYPFYQHLAFAKLFAFVMVFIIGIGASMVQIPAQTLLHLHSDEEKRGRVFGISSMQLRLATTVPTIIVAAVSDLTSPLITMVLLAVFSLMYALMLVFE